MGRSRTNRSAKGKLAVWCVTATLLLSGFEGADAAGDGGHGSDMPAGGRTAGRAASRAGLGREALLRVGGTLHIDTAGGGAGSLGGVRLFCPLGTEAVRFRIGGRVGLDAGGRGLDAGGLITVTYRF